jgi:hypothetical protein
MAAVFRHEAFFLFLLRLSLAYSFVGRSGRYATPKTIGGSMSRRASPTKGLSFTAPAKPSSTVAMAATTAASKGSESTTTTPTSGAVRLALIFPASRERFRNLTRAIEYSVVHDDVVREDGEGEEEEWISESTGPNRSESLRRLMAWNHLWSASRDDSVEGTLRDTGIHELAAAPSHVTTDASAASLGHNNNHPYRNWTRLERLARTLLRWFSLWWFVAKSSLESRRKQKGFSATDLGGTKRHYALLVASLVSGATKGSLGGLWASSSNIANLYDPLAYHHAVVQSAHHRTVASLSPSALAFSEQPIRVSALQRHALKWVLRANNSKKRKRIEQQKQQK